MMVYEFTDDFTVAAVGRDNQMDVMLEDDVGPAVTLRLDPDQVKQCLSLFHNLYAVFVEDGVIEAYPDIPLHRTNGSQ